MVRGLGSQTKLALEVVATLLTIAVAVVTLGGGLPGGNTMVNEATTTVGSESPETTVITGSQSETTITNTSVDETGSPSASSSEVEAEVVSFSPVEKTFEKGDVQRTRVTIENTGNTKHTFFVGYSVRSPTGEGLHDEGPTEPSVTLAPGETGTVTVEWTVDTDAPAGTYGIIVAVWEDREDDDLQNQLDRREETTVFEVTNATN